MIAIYLFYNHSAGPQAWLALSKEFRHCNTLVYDGEMWLLVEFDASGLKWRKINPGSFDSLWRGLKIVKSLVAMVCVAVDAPQKVSWKPFLVRSCNEIGRYTVGLGIGFTWTPRHLYNKLLALDGKRNYHVLRAWRRDYGAIR